MHKMIATTIFSIATLATLPLMSEKTLSLNETVQKKGGNLYQAKDFSYLLGKVKGLDDSLLKMHFTLYQGYVKNGNALLEQINNLLKDSKELSYEFGALKRRVGWELDGMYLHELYFANLGGSAPLNKGNLYQAITNQFGDFETWKKDFIATGSMRGIGWVVLYQDPKDKRLINTWINEHDVGHLAGGVPLLVMDVFEHAYMTQFGLDKAKYISVFFDNINWSEVEKRYEKKP